MTNREKFAEQILDIACSGSKIAVDKATLEPAPCYKLARRDCLFSFGNGDCRGARKESLLRKTNLRKSARLLRVRA